MIEKILNTKSISYSSNLSEDQLKDKIVKLFKQDNLSFVGEFISQNEFAAYDKWTYITWFVTNFKRKTAYLKGEIIKTGKHTRIKLNITPNPVVAIFPLATILIGVVALIIAGLNGGNNKILILGIITSAVGILFYLLGMFFNNRLHTNFKKYLNL